MLVSRPGIEPKGPVVERQNPNHWLPGIPQWLRFYSYDKEIISVLLTLWEGGNETLNKMIFVKSLLKIINGNIHKI